MINDSIHNWVNNNKQRLRYYKRRYVAYNAEDGIIAYDDELQVLLNKANATTSDFAVHYVNPLSYRTRILPIHFKTVKTHDWE